MKHTSLKLGQLYQVSFLDHTMFSGNEGMPLQCEAVGRLSRITEKTIELTAWSAGDIGWENNNEGFCIVRSCITNARRLK